MVKRPRNRHDVDEYIAPDNLPAPDQHTLEAIQHTKCEIGDSAAKASRIRTRMTIYHEAGPSQDSNHEAKPSQVSTVIADSNCLINTDSYSQGKDDSIPDNLALEAVGLVLNTEQTRPRRTRLVCNKSCSHCALCLQKTDQSLGRVGALY